MILLLTRSLTEYSLLDDVLTNLSTLTESQPEVVLPYFFLNAVTTTRARCSTAQHRQNPTSMSHLNILLIRGVKHLASSPDTLGLPDPAESRFPQSVNAKNTTGLT